MAQVPTRYLWRAIQPGEQGDHYFLLSGSEFQQASAPVEFAALPGLHVEAEELSDKRAPGSSDSELHRISFL